MSITFRMADLGNRVSETNVRIATASVFSTLTASVNKAHSARLIGRAIAPDGICKGSIPCDVPHGKSCPLPARCVNRPGVGVLVKLRRRLEIDDLALGSRAVAPDKLCKPEWEC